LPQTGVSYLSALVLPVVSSRADRACRGNWQTSVRRGILRRARVAETRRAVSPCSRRPDGRRINALAHNEGGAFMPEFCSPFTGLAHDRKLTKEELVRAIRFMIAAEYEAIQLYMQLAESTDHALAIEVLTDIADEERVHAGEFLRLLRELAPDEEKFYSEGAEEVEEEIGKAQRK
jgi:hypothetical protein